MRWASAIAIAAVLSCQPAADAPSSPKNSSSSISAPGTLFSNAHRDTMRSLMLPGFSVIPDPVRSYFVLHNSPGSPRRVLAYLRDMIDVCRGFHRHDLVREYTEAWELAATRIYGPLPPYQPIHRTAYDWTPKTNARPAPPWKAAMLAKPFHKIVRRYQDDGLDYELLECGHSVYAPVTGEGPQARRRRCADCAHEAAAAATPPSVNAQGPDSGLYGKRKTAAAASSRSSGAAAFLKRA